MFCKNCGQQLPEGVSFCPNCGAPAEVNETEQQQYTAPEQQYTAPEQQYAAPEQPVYAAETWRPTIEKKNIATAIVLSIVTCGIYGIYWVYCMVRDLDIVTGNEDETVLQFILCAFIPFYSIYWLYTRDKKLVDAASRYGVVISDNSVIMLILVICQLGIVSWALLQNDLNSFAN